MRAAAVLAAAAASLVLLSACATEPPPPTGLTDAQLAALARPILDAQWNAIEPHLAGAARPSVERVRFVTPSEQVTAVAACLDGLGYADGAMVFSADGFIIQTTPILDGVRYQLDAYTCQAEYPVDPRVYGALSTAQLDYLYDYYRRWTIPCLNANDYPVPVLPTRQEFLETGSPDWTPYYNSSASGGTVPPTVLRGRCGVVPPGLFPSEYVDAVRDGQDRVNGWGRWVDR